MIWRILLATVFAVAGIYGMGMAHTDFRRGRYLVGASEAVVGYALVLVAVVLIFIPEE